MNQSKVNQKTTNELMHLLSEVHTEDALKEYTEGLEHIPHYHSFAEYMNAKISESKMSVASIIQNAQIQRNYGYQILNGSKNPGRNKVIAFSLTLHFSLEDTQRALTLAGESVLYSKNKRDSILIFSLQKGLSVQQTNELLFELQENIL